MAMSLLIVRHFKLSLDSRIVKREKKISQRKTDTRRTDQQTT